MVKGVPGAKIQKKRGTPMMFEDRGGKERCFQAMGFFGPKHPTESSYSGALLFMVVGESVDKLLDQRRFV